MSRRKKAAALPSAPLRKALVVLGMHRSGTSALAGVLGQMGADLPADLMGPREMNAKGFFESNRITGLNEELLASAGQRWFTYEPVPPAWFASPKADEFGLRATEAIAADYGDSHLFVLKDPRICRLLPFWHQALDRSGCEPLHVCTHRHPLDVAASMDRWSNYEQSYGQFLWLRHVLEAEAASRGRPRVFTSYERLMTDWAAVVTAIGDGLGLSWPRSPQAMRAEVGTFLSGTLQHFKRGSDRPGVEMAEAVAQTYAILDSWAEAGEQPGDHARLDRIREGIAQTGPTFGPTLWRNHLEQRELKALKQRLATLEAEVRASRDEAATHSANHATEQRLRGAAEAQVVELATVLERLQAEAAGHAANHATEQQMRGATLARLAEVEAALAAAQAEVARSTQALAEAAVTQASLTAAEAEAAARATQLAAEADRLRAQSAAQATALAQRQHEAQATEARLQAELAAAQDTARAQGAALERARADLTRLEQDLASTAAARAESAQAADQLRSALAQRQQETEDLHRQTQADAARLATLDAQLRALQQDHARQVALAVRDGRHLAAMTARLTLQMERDIDRRLAEPAERAAAERARAAEAAEAAERDRQLQALEAAQADLQAERDWLAQALDTARAEVEALQGAQAGTAAERDQLAQDLAHLHKATDRDHQALASELAQLRTRLTAQAARQEARLGEVQAERAALHAELETLRRDSTARLEAMRTRLESRIATQTDRAATNRRLRARLQAELDALRDSSAADSAALSAETARLQQAAEARIAALDARLVQAAEARAALETRLADAAETHAALTAHLQALQDSTSWKVTSPLRRISSGLRGSRS